jgi:hypothetical protein
VRRNEDATGPLLEKTETSQQPNSAQGEFDEKVEPTPILIEKRTGVSK